MIKVRLLGIIHWTSVFSTLLTSFVSTLAIGGIINENMSGERISSCWIFLYLHHVIPPVKIRQLASLEDPSIALCRRVINIYQRKICITSLYLSKNILAYYRPKFIQHSHIKNSMVSNVQVPETKNFNSIMKENKGVSSLFLSMWGIAFYLKLPPKSSINHRKGKFHMSFN